MTRLGGMRTVPDPIERLTKCHGFIKGSLQGHEDRIKFLCQAANSLLFAEQDRTADRFGSACILLSFDMGKGFKKDDLQIGILFTAHRQKPAVMFLISGSREVRCGLFTFAQAIVDTDKHGKHVGRDIERIRLPTREQVGYGVAGDTLIDECQMPLREIHAEKSRQNIYVAVSDLMIFIPFGGFAFIACAIGNGITLK